MSLHDLETYADEWHTVTPFYVLRVYCRLLEIDLVEYIPSSVAHPVVAHGRCGSTIAHYRQLISLSVPEFADRVGIAEHVAPLLEIGDAIIIWPFDVIQFVADALKLDCRSFVKATLLDAR